MTGRQGFAGQADSHGKNVQWLRAGLKNREPEELARLSGAVLKENAEGTRYLQLDYWERKISIGLPDFVVAGVDEETEALILHYLHTADGTERGGRWLSLAELPDGAFYRQAYQGYSGDKLAFELQNDMEALQRAAVQLSGKEEEFGDLSFSFDVLPRMSLLLVYHYGDDEFPAAAQVLFSDSTSHCLPTDICAYLGRLLVDRILESR
jgi:hypothetical protein